MSKKVILTIIILLFIVCGVFTGIYLKNNEKNIVEDNLPEEITIYEDIQEEPTEKYVDDNNVKLGIYIEKGNNLELINEYSCDWSPENVLNIFYAIPSQDKVISNYGFDSMWKEKISEYPNAEQCRIGYNLSFEYSDGNTYNYQILNPEDAYHTFPKIMSFLYDDVNLVPGKTYYHITQDVMYDYTIASSIKLVGDVDTNKITSDITLTAFCFDSADDFDSDTGLYRGNSKYVVTIKNNK